MMEVGREDLIRRSVKYPAKSEPEKLWNRRLSYVHNG